MMRLPKPAACEGCPLNPFSTYYTPDKVNPHSTVSLLVQNPGQHEEDGQRLVRARRYSKPEVCEAVEPQPLIGASGNALRRDFWPHTKLRYDTISLHNVIKCRPYGTNDLPDIGNNKPVQDITVPMLKQAIAHCTHHYLKFPDHTKYVMAMGELSLYALTGEQLLHYRKDSELEEEEQKRSTITEWRGWAL